MNHDRLSRRRLLKTGAAISLASIIPPIAHAQTEEKVLIYGTRGGLLEDTFRRTVLKPFEAATGITIKLVPYPEMARVKAMVDTNTVDLDIWEPDAKEITILGRRGLMEPIDYSLLPSNLKDDLIPGSIHKYGVGEVLYGAGIVYSTEKFSKENHPRTWAEFWDTKRFKGPRTMPDASYQISAFEAALLADGVPADKLYPLDIDRAFRSFARIKPDIVKFWTKTAEGMTLLTSGNAELSMQTFGRVIALKAQQPNTKLEVEFNQGITKFAYLGIPKGAKHPKNAHKLIAFYCNPKIQADFINAYPAYGPVSKAAMQLIDPKNEDLVVSSKKNAPGLVMVNEEWWSAEDASGKSNFEKVLDRWNTFVSSK